MGPTKSAAHNAHLATRGDRYAAPSNGGIIALQYDFMMISTRISKRCSKEIFYAVMNTKSTEGVVIFQETCDLVDKPSLQMFDIYGCIGITFDELFDKFLFTLPF